jgi:hypothetical protein
VTAALVTSTFSQRGSSGLQNEQATGHSPCLQPGTYRLSLYQTGAAEELDRLAGEKEGNAEDTEDTKCTCVPSQGVARSNIQYIEFIE